MWFDPSWLVDPPDLDGDGFSDAPDIEDLSLIPGSKMAKAYWDQVTQQVTSPDSLSRAQEINPDALGMYKGQPIVPGEIGGGGFSYLRDKLILERGLSPMLATKIASKSAIKAIIQ